MKKLFTLLLVAVISFGLYSCGDEAKPVDDSLKLGQFRARVDDADWRADEGKVTSAIMIEPPADTVLMIRGTHVTDASKINFEDQLNIYMVNPAMGINTSKRVEFVNKEGAESTEWYMEKAKVTVTFLDSTQIKGTFSFTGYNPDDGTRKEIKDINFWAPMPQ